MPSEAQTHNSHIPDEHPNHLDHQHSLNLNCLCIACSFLLLWSDCLPNLRALLLTPCNVISPLCNTTDVVQWLCLYCLLIYKYVYGVNISSALSYIHTNTPEAHLRCGLYILKDLTHLASWLSIYVHAWYIHYVHSWDHASLTIVIQTLKGTGIGWRVSWSILQFICVYTPAHITVL